MNTLKDFLAEIKGFIYVVQRNWENLPESYAVDGHEDLDLFATNDDKSRIQSVLQKYPDIKCDVRSEEDDYYPVDIADHLLSNRLETNGFFIPNDQAAFDALYYHNLIHKEGNPYGKKLAQMFKKIYAPVRCKDMGVGHYDTD